MYSAVYDAGAMMRAIARLGCLVRYPLGGELARFTAAVPNIHY